MDRASKAKCCCATGPSCGGPREPGIEQPAPPSSSWIIGTVAGPAGNVSQISTQLRWSDYVGAWMVRWAIRRMGYRVAPGLYAVGAPNRESPVLVSANYKLSFDRLRSQLTGVDAWILVLDTQGVNVWCAAGKGSFGTEELVRRIEQFGLGTWTAHRTVIVPQLGGPGVAAHDVRKRTGVRVVYGPVRAADLPPFLAAGMRAEPAMRQVHFGLADRLALVPVELVTTAKWVLLAAGVLLTLTGLGPGGFSWSRLIAEGAPVLSTVLLAAVGSLLLGPALLPWLPGRSFALKGLWIGLGLTAVCSRLFTAAFGSWLGASAWWLILSAMSSLLLLKFTGATTYTSLSGVRREMRIAVPLQLASFTVGTLLWLVSRFL